jgi:hypothetical protein
MSDMPSCLYTHFIAPSDGADVAYWSLWAREQITGFMSDVQKCILRLTNRECACVHVNPWPASRFGRELHSTYDVSNFEDTTQCIVLLGDVKDVMMTPLGGKTRGATFRGKRVRVPVLDSSLTKVRLLNIARDCKNIPLMRWLIEEEPVQYSIGSESRYRACEDEVFTDCAIAIAEAGDLELLDRWTGTPRFAIDMRSRTPVTAGLAVERVMRSFIRGSASVADKVEFIRRGFRDRTEARALNFEMCTQCWGLVAWIDVAALGDVDLMQEVAVDLALVYDVMCSRACYTKMPVHQEGDQSDLILVNVHLIKKMQGQPGTNAALDWMLKFGILADTRTRIPTAAAIKNDDVTLLRRLVEDPALPWHRATVPTEDLWTAIRFGKQQTAAYLLSIGVYCSPDYVSQVISNGDVEILEAIIEHDFRAISRAYRSVHREPRTGLRSRERGAVRMIDVMETYDIRPYPCLVKIAIDNHCDLLVDRLLRHKDIHIVEAQYRHMYDPGSRRFDEAMDKLDLGFKWLWWCQEAIDRR